MTTHKHDFTLTYPEPPDKLKRRLTLGTALAFLGPGAIIASANIGSGEMIFAARGGALFGYALIWAYLVAAATKAALAYSMNRYTVVTGEHPMTRWAEVIPGPRGWFPLVFGMASVLVVPSWVSGLGLAIGDLIGSATIGSGQVWTTAIILLSIAFAWFGGYKVMEKAQTLIVGFMLLAMVVSVAFVNADWLGALAGLVPSVPEFPQWVQAKYPDIGNRSIWLEVGTYLGAVGGGTYDYIAYSGMLKEKKWGLLGRRDADNHDARTLSVNADGRLPISETPEEVQKMRAWTRAPRADIILNFSAIVIFAAIFMINGASILREDRLVPSGSDTLTYQGGFFEAVFPGLAYLYYIGVFFAFFGSLYAFWEMYSHTVYESLAPVSERVRRAGQRAVRPYMYVYMLVASLVLVWSGAGFVYIVTPASVLGGLLMCGVFCLVLVWTEYKVLPKSFRLGIPGQIWVVLSGLFLCFLGVVSLWELFM